MWHRLPFKALLLCGCLVALLSGGVYALVGESPFAARADEVGRSPNGADETPPVLLAAVSRRPHGVVGSFNVDLPLGPVEESGVEPRFGGPTLLLLTFSEPISALDGTVSDDEVILSHGTLDGVFINGELMAIYLSFVPDKSCLSVTLTGLADEAGNPLAGIHTFWVRVLFGDANGDGVVASGDITQVKSVSGQTVNENIFRRDVNGDGVVASGDITQVKSRSGSAVECLAD
jgi:hypothetical protein